MNAIFLNVECAYYIFATIILISYSEWLARHVLCHNAINILLYCSYDKLNFFFFCCCCRGTRLDIRNDVHPLTSPAALLYNFIPNVSLLRYTNYQYRGFNDWASDWVCRSGKIGLDNGCQSWVVCVQSSPVLSSRVHSSPVLSRLVFVVALQQLCREMSLICVGQAADRLTSPTNDERHPGAPENRPNRNATAVSAGLAK